MDLFIGILIGVALGVWLSVLALFLANRAQNLEAFPRRTVYRPAASSPSAQHAPHEPGPAAMPPPVGNRGVQENIADTAVADAYQVTLGEVERESKRNEYLADQLRYLDALTHGDRALIQRLIRYEQKRSPSGEIEDWVEAAVNHWQRDNR